MLKVKGSGGGGGKASKSRGVGAEVRRVETKLQTEADKLVTLRAALRGGAGEDRDVMAEFPSFQKFSGGDGLQAKLLFKTSTTLSRDEKRWMVRLCETNQREEYDESGYGWDRSEKRSEFNDGAARIILVREVKEGGEDGKDIAFMHFRFTVTGELLNENSGEPTLIVYDLQVEEDYQRRGIGRRLMCVAELAARKWGMKSVVVPLVRGSASREFFGDVLRGYVPDPMFDTGDADEPQVVLSKPIVVRRAGADSIAKALVSGDAAPKAVAADAASAAASTPARATTSTDVSPDVVTAAIEEPSTAEEPDMTKMTRAQRKRMRQKMKKQQAKEAKAAAAGSAPPAEAAPTTEATA